MHQQSLEARPGVEESVASVNGAVGICDVNDKPETGVTRQLVYFAAHPW